MPVDMVAKMKNSTIPIIFLGDKSKEVKTGRAIDDILFLQ